MKKEQLQDKFIICRTPDEVDFVVYWAQKLLGYDMSGAPRKCVCIRLKPYERDGNYGYSTKIGFYEKHPSLYGYVKEEECSMLFGNLIKRWKHENRT